ncbi:MAG: TonB-dependent receptor, partial [Pseudomonadales bacterium]
LGGVISGPVSENVLFRLAAENHQSDGYTENAFLGRDDVNARDETTLRGKILFSSGDRHTSTFSLFHLDVDNGYDAFSLDNTRVTLSDEPGHDRQKTTAGSLHSQWQFQAFDFAVLASAATSKSAYGYDEDWTYTGIHPFGYTSTDDYRRQRDTLSLEARFISNQDSRIMGNSTDWVFGFYSLNSNEDLLRNYTFLPGPFDSRYDFTTLAAFFQLDTNLTDRTILTSGLRLEQRDTRYSDSEGVAFNPQDTLWGGRVAIKFMLDNVMSYVSVARGYKAGGFNTDGSLDQDLREFDSEFLWELEAGVKGTALDGLLQFRSAVFYDLRRDQQVKSSLVRPRPDGSTEFIDFVGNAAEGTNYGLELETDWLVSDNFTMIASIGLLETEFDEFINEVGDDLSGRAQAHAPGYMYALGGNYTAGNWFATVSIDGKDDFYFSDRHNLRSTGSTIVNANVGYRGQNWSARLWGRNLMDDDYTIRGFGSFGNDPRKNYIVEPYVQFGEPRIIGVTFEYDLN